MTFDEWRVERDSLTDRPRLQCIYAHFRARALERFNIVVSYAEWERLSYECASRELDDIIWRDDRGHIVRHNRNGIEMGLAYNRHHKALATTYQPDFYPFERRRYSVSRTDAANLKGKHIRITTRGRRKSWRP